MAKDQFLNLLNISLLISKGAANPDDARLQKMEEIWKNEIFLIDFLKKIKPSFEIMRDIIKLPGILNNEEVRHLIKKAIFNGIKEKNVSHRISAMQMLFQIFNKGYFYEELSEVVKIATHCLESSDSDERSIASYLLNFTKNMI
ncbi:MAG: hypothetical protein H0X29_07085 [Parachlamydiaceae bacterium]|nr:hypothetical protein [Parachlamydiaceae bacterium]